MAEKTCSSDRNMKFCTCSYSCGKKGICCDCIHYHRRNGELPACYFPKDEERSGNRSIANFMAIVQKKGTAFLK